MCHLINSSIVNFFWNLYVFQQSISLYSSDIIYILYLFLHIVSVYTFFLVHILAKSLGIQKSTVKQFRLVWAQRRSPLLQTQDATLAPRAWQLCPPGVTTSPLSHVHDSISAKTPPHGSFTGPLRLVSFGFAATTARPMARMRKAIFMMGSDVFPETQKNTNTFNIR